MTIRNIEKINKKKQSYRKQNTRRETHTDWYQVSVGFNCKHCGAYVSSSMGLSGVLNRNHCPYCLWSKHVDLYQSGDRLCACKGKMRPVGVTFKREKKKYGSGLGELQLIHRCTDCSGLSINRIAADDDAELIWEIYLGSNLANSAELETAGIIPAGAAEKELVYGRLFGFCE